MIKNVKFIISLLLVIGIVLIAIFSHYLCPYDPYEQNLSDAFQSPGLSHFMGTDAYGRDMFSRVLTGGKVSILSTLILVGTICIFGTIIGILCGYLGGKFDYIVK